MSARLALAAAVALSILTSAGTPAAAEPAKPAPAVLRSSAVISGPVLRLGDLFLNVGDKADQRIADSPPPGTSLVLDAGVLARLARAYGLAWQPSSPQDRLVVERPSRVVEGEEVDRLLRAALAEKGIEVASLVIELNGAPPRLVIAADAAAGVEGLNYQPTTRRFTATIGVRSGDGAASAATPGASGGPSVATSSPRLLLSGVLSQSVDVPVLARRVQPGEIIGERDVQWLRANDRRLPANAVLDATMLIGNTVRRPITAGSPVPYADLRRPVAVSKGALVTLVVSGPFLQLTTRGRALHDAAVGDPLRVVNESSHGIVEGVVAANGQVIVAAAPAPTAPPATTTARRALN